MPATDLSDDAEGAVRRYLVFLDDPRKLRDEAAIQRLTQAVLVADDPIDKLKALAELERAAQVDEKSVRDGFVEHARAWAAAEDVPVTAFRELGVPDDALRDAGFDVPAGPPRRARAGRATATGAGSGRVRARAVPVDAIKAHVLSLDGPFVLSDVMHAVGGSPATIRKAVDELVEADQVTRLGPVPDHTGPGRTPVRYTRGLGRPAVARPGPTFIRPLVDFLHTEAAGGIVLVAATLAALVWANSPWDAGYRALWDTHLAIGFGDHVLDLDLREWVSEGLMALFFLVVGLEIKRELVEGELSDPRQAALPVVAALGGMAVPAAIYLTINAGGDGAAGWGIPMATDIAMAVGVLSLLGSRVAPSLKLFLLALAIVDDIGAVLVIAVAYTREIDPASLAAAAGIVAGIAALRVAGVRARVAYVVAGVALWLALHESGLHATLAGVVLGLMTPTRPARQPELIDAAALADVSSVTAARETASLAREAVSEVEWLEHSLHPWTGFVVVPLFALANAGIVVNADTVRDAASSPIAAGVVAGLVVGKPLGIAAFSWLAVRLRLARLPAGTSWAALMPVACLAGIGFTVSILVAGLAFDDPARVEVAKLAILTASVLAALAGSTLVLLGARDRPGTPS